MKKAWKIENVDCTHLKLKVFSFVFESLEERNRVLEVEPWSFSRHLLILKPWKPTTLPKCLPFNSSSFWMHILGLAVEGRKEEVIRSMAEKIGSVESIKTESKGFVGLAICKEKVNLSLEGPLEYGIIYNFKGKEL